MPELALFGITDEGLNLVVNLLVLFLVVVYIALVVWTYMDARRRLEDPVLVTTATVASLFPFVGTVIYTILRPPEFLSDKRERELEMQTAKLRVRQLEEASCPNCSHPIERTYLRCPQCRTRVKDPCESCAKPIDPRWSVCPYCETPVRRAQPQQRQQGRQQQRRGGAPRPPRQKRPAQERSGSREAAGAGSGAPAPRPASASAKRPGSRKPPTGAGRPASEVKAPKRSASKGPAGNVQSGSGSKQGARKNEGENVGAPTQEAPAVPEPEPADK
jgi:hypothetical protein